MKVACQQRIHQAGFAGYFIDRCRTYPLRALRNRSSHSETHLLTPHNQVTVAQVQQGNGQGEGSTSASVPPWCAGVIRLYGPRTAAPAASFIHHHHPQLVYVFLLLYTQSLFPQSHFVEQLFDIENDVIS